VSTVKIKDFSHSLEPKQFEINGDIFLATPELPLGIMQDMVRFRNIREQLEEEGLEPVLRLLDALLFDESAERFRARVKDKQRPIGITHVMEIIPWLMEEYGLRPTQPSQPSSSGSSDETTGTSSTAGRSLAELTQLGNQLTQPST
jgi:hypothetical protein